VPRPRPQRLEAEAVEQVVDGLEASQHAELRSQDAADVLAPQGADPVGVGRAGPEAVFEPLLLVGIERSLAAAAVAVGQGVGPAGVVAGQPGADLAVGQQHLCGDGPRSVAKQGQPDGGQAAGDAGAGLGTDEGCQLLSGAVRLDVHGGLLPGCRQTTPIRTGTEVNSRDPY